MEIVGGGRRKKNRSKLINKLLFFNISKNPIFFNSIIIPTGQRDVFNLTPPSDREMQFG